MKRALIVNLYFILSINLIYSQVTIGSHEVPLAGTLLDLKQTGETKGGLGMPRVELQAYDKLKMGENATEHTDKKAHTGLVVYNLETNICDVNIPTTGLYVWNGDKWEGLSVPEKYKPTPPPIMKSAIYQPNAYIVKGTTTEEIPIEKAYAVWENWPHYSGTGTMLPVTKFTGNPEAEIVWQEKSGTNFIINTVSLDDPSKGRDAKLLVTLNGVEGNAVVGVRIDGEIRWSWHIWVTDTDFEDPQNQRQFNGLTWMDRNLGATSNQAGNEGCIGLLYQWGRKDPFPTAKVWSDTEAIVYLGANKMPNSVMNLLKQVTVDEIDNLSTSIQSPLAFIFSMGGSSSGADDWYSMKASTWDTRWLRDEFEDASCPAFKYTITSISSPCPAGWAVPLSTASTTAEHHASPWGDLDIITPSNFRNDKGWNWADADYYPAGGARLGINNYCTHTRIGQMGLYWTALPSTKSALDMSFSDLYVDHMTGSLRTNGQSVRCVKE